MGFISSIISFYLILFGVFSALHKLQVAIDQAIIRSNSYKEFLKLMESYSYEIKFGKYISFKHRNQNRFTRAKTIDPDYSEEKIKERIQATNRGKAHNVNHIPKKKESSYRKLINIDDNPKIKGSKEYEIWANKFNMKLTAETLNELRKYNIKDYSDLESLIQHQVAKRQGVLTEI